MPEDFFTFFNVSIRLDVESVVTHFTCDVVDVDISISVMIYEIDKRNKVLAKFLIGEVPAPTNEIDLLKLWISILLPELLILFCNIRILIQHVFFHLSNGFQYRTAL